MATPGNMRPGGASFAASHSSSHTRVAVAADGALLSIIHDWPLTVYAVDGQPQRVGRLSHVFTRPDARRQG